MEFRTAAEKSLRFTYPRKSPRRLPPAFDDVADFAHSPDIGVGDALAVRAAIAIGIEAPRSVAEHLALVGRCDNDGARILSGHVAVERCEPGIAADRQLSLRTGVRATEARTRHIGLRRGRRNRWRLRCRLDR